MKTIVFVGRGYDDDPDSVTVDGVELPTNADVVNGLLDSISSKMLKVTIEILEEVPA